jgi:spore coat polysaccharide biosynthesis protein SpsF
VIDVRIGFLVTARLKSKRLPFKLLRPLRGKTVIDRVIERAKEVKYLSDVILCTSTNPQDRPLIDAALNNGVYYFVGDETDVVRRLLQAAKFFDLDYFLAITADNPLLTIHYSNVIANEAKRGRYDFIKLEGLPLGVATYGVRVNAFEIIDRLKPTADSEFWAYLLNKPEIFSIKTVTVRDKLNRPDLRLTLDYEEDYELISNIYSHVPFNTVLDLYDVMDYLGERPELAKLNANCIQREMAIELKAQIDRVYAENEKQIETIKRDIYSTV